MPVVIITFPPSGTGGGAFSDSDWPSTLNRPTFASGTNTLTWVGPSGGGANNGNPVQQSRVLTNSGSVTSSNPGQIIEGLNISGAGVVINISHNNVTIRQCRINTSGNNQTCIVMGFGGSVTGVTIEDCLIDGNKASLEGIYTISAITGGSPNVIRRCNLRGCENNITIWPGDNFSITDNLSTNSGNSFGTPPHLDHIEIYGGNIITISHNYFDGQFDDSGVVSSINITGQGAGSNVANLAINNNMHANFNNNAAWVINDDNTQGGTVALSSFVNNGFYNRGIKDYRRDSVTITTNNTNYDAATSTATSGTLINGTGVV